MQGKETRRPDRRDEDKFGIWIKNRRKGILTVDKKKDLTQVAPQ
jgi:hypothetical protein